MLASAIFVEAWEFDPSCELSDVVHLADARLAPPSLTGRLIAAREDALTIQVQSGPDRLDPRSLWYVGGHGAYVLARREEWPPPSPGGARRQLLTLRACAHEGSAAGPTAP